MNNLILVSLDTLRADVGYSGKYEAIEDLRRDGVTLLNTISSAPLTPTSHASVFTGCQPINHGIRHLFKEKLNKKVTTLAQVFKKNGYTTSAIVSCPGMNKWYGFSRGFDFYDDEIPKLADGSDPLLTIDVKKRGTALKRANIVVERATKWLRENKEKPFFLFLHFFDAHWPYDPPQKYGGNNLYEQEVAFTDHYLKIFIDTLKTEGLYQNSTIIFFSDHGEDLEGLYKNDKGGKKLGHPEEFGHGCLLYDQTQKVIFIIKDNSLSGGINFVPQVRLIDIFPTILDLMKIKNDYSIDGESLISAIKNKTDPNLIAYSETLYPEEQKKVSGKFLQIKNKKSIRINNKYKIIFNLNSDIFEIYNLENDPNELNNLFSNK